MRFFRRRTGDLVDEIDTHLSLLEEEYRRTGMSVDEARDAARRSFGGVLKTRQVYNEQGRWAWLAALAHDARSATRMTTRDRRSALGPILVVGLGIGANALVFTLGYSHTLRGLPIAGADRVLMASHNEAGTERFLSWPEFDELRSRARLLSDVAALGATTPVSVGDNGRAPDRYQATYITSNAFDAISVRPSIGRMFTDDEDRPDAARVAVMGRGLFEARYAADPTIIGRDILINGRATTVVGVLPDRHGLPSTAEVWLPATQAPGLTLTDRTVRAVRAFGPVRDGTSIEAARAELEALLATLASQTPGSRLQPSVTPINARFFGSPTVGVWMAFFSAGVLVLLVSSANVANMMLARGVQRAREMAIRGSLGASRARLFTQLIFESVVIAAAGAAIGFSLARAGIGVVRTQIPAGVLPYWLHYSMDVTLFASLVVISFVAVLIFGLLPAVQVSRTDVIKVLRDGGWGGSGRSSSRHWTTGFMAIQIGLAMVLLAYAVTNSLNTDDPPPSDAAINTRDVLTASLALPADRYSTATQRADFYRSLSEHVQAVPGVSSVALTGIVPRTGAIEQRLQLTTTDTAPEQLRAIATLSAGPDYFSTLRVPLLQGREFDARDQASDPTAIVNRRFVSTFFAGEAALERRITLVNPATKAARTLRIVGVADDIRHRAAVEPVVYQPVAVAAPATIFLLVRHQLEPSTMTTQLRDAVLALDPNLPVFNAQTLARAVSDAGWNGRFSVRLISTLTVIVLTLAGVGLSSTAAQAVYQRTKEIGIRVAVGARPGEIARLVLKRVAPPVALGLLLGVLFTWGWDAIFFSGSNDEFAAPDALAVIAAILLSIVTMACMMPVRHAVRLDPVVALRQD